MFDFAGAPMFFATTLNMFEGNAMILNLYSEADKPQHFSKYVSFVMVTIAIFGMFVGLVTYYTYGNLMTDGVL